MSTQSGEADASDALGEIKRDIVELADMRRSARRGEDAFFEQPSWLALAMVSFSTSAEPRDRAKAAEILARYQDQVRDIIDALPALNPYGRLDEGAAIDERFGAFHSVPFMRNLDLWRRQHRLDMPDWYSTDVLDAGFDSLMDELSSVTAEDPYGRSWSRFTCVVFDKTPATCQMILRFATPEAAAAGLAHCMRITKRADVVDTVTGDVITIAKRTEFIVDLNKLEPGYGARLRDGIQTNLSGYQLGWNRRNYNTMESLISRERNRAIQPVYTTLFAFRENCQVTDVVTSRDELADHPDLYRRVYAPRVLEEGDDLV